MNFNFDREYILENDFVLLRPLKRDDFINLIAFSIKEPELWKYSITPADSEKNLKNYLNVALEGRENQREYPFIVYDKTKGEYAGSTRFYDIKPVNLSLQLGYTWYGGRFQRTGLNTNCKFLLLEFAFDTLGVERVEFRADNDNKRSIKAMERIGCTKEGILRSTDYKADGSRRDSIVLSILKSEWKDNIKNELKQKC